MTKPTMDADTADTVGYVECELSHDLREMGDAGLERVRWNNRSMLMAVNRIRELEVDRDRLLDALFSHLCWEAEEPILVKEPYAAVKQAERYMAMLKLSLAALDGRRTKKT